MHKFASICFLAISTSDPKGGKSETPHILDGQLVETSNLTTRRCGLITRPINRSIKQVNNSANMGVD